MIFEIGGKVYLLIWVTKVHTTKENLCLDNNRLVLNDGLIVFWNNMLLLLLVRDEKYHLWSFRGEELKVQKKSFENL